MQSGHGTHDDIQSLLGAYALDAVDPDEAALVERHLPVCPRCRSELSEHREVAGLLGYAGQEAPAGLWDRIATSMQEAPPELLLAPLGADDRVGGPADHGRPGTVVRLGDRLPGAPRARANRRTRGAATVRVRTVAVLAAAAAVVVAVLGVQVARLVHRQDALANAVAATGDIGPSMQVVQAALHTSGSRHLVLSAMTPGDTVQAVLLPGGQGYLYYAHLSPLPSSQTYQLWGITGSDAVSYGLIGTVAPPVVAFRAGSGVQALAVTAEVAGGVVRTTHAPVAAGQVSPPL
ncbi:MAG TPA: zf-HC2 domain-containing protein [Acidimicrobiales bacterium]|nr:zf-HC2 domain-containing protein [Acidimicrobiales bacterium]